MAVGKVTKIHAGVKLEIDGHWHDLADAAIAAKESIEGFSGGVVTDGVLPYIVSSETTKAPNDIHWLPSSTITTYDFCIDKFGAVTTGIDPSHERTAEMGTLRFLEHCYFTDSKPAYSRVAQWPFLISGDNGAPIYTVPGWNYYGLVQESLRQLQGMTDAEVAALAGAGSVKYGGMLSEKVCAELLRELAVRPLMKEILPGVHALDDGNYLAVGSIGRIRRKPSKRIVLRQHLPIRGMGAYKIDGDHFFHSMNNTTMQWDKTPLSSVGSHSKKEALIVIFDARAPSWFKSYQEVFANIGKHLIAEAYGLASYTQDDGAVQTEIEDIRLNQNAWKMIYSSYSHTTTRGSEFSALRLATEKSKELIDRGLNVTVLLASTAAPTGMIDPILGAAKELSMTATRFYHVLKGPLPQSDQIFDYHYLIKKAVGKDTELLGSAKYSGFRKIANAILDEVMPPMCIHELQRGYYCAYRLLYVTSQITVKEAAEQLSVPRSRILVQYHGKSRLVKPPSFIQTHGSFGLVTTPILNQCGHVYKQAYSGERLIIGGEPIVVLKYNPVTLLAGPSFDRSVIM